MTFRSVLEAASIFWKEDVEKFYFQLAETLYHRFKMSLRLVFCVVAALFPCLAIANVGPPVYMFRDER